MAITDRREIEFDTDAVRSILEASPYAAQAFGLPPLTPEAVRCRPELGHVEVVYGTLTKLRVFALRAEPLGAILVSYCNRAGMPMPRLADKAIRVERNHVVLVLTLRLEAVPPPEAPEGAIARAPEAVRAWAWIEPPREG